MKVSKLWHRGEGVTLCEVCFGKGTRDEMVEFKIGNNEKECNNQGFVKLFQNLLLVA